MQLTFIQNFQAIGLMYDAVGILVLGVPAFFRAVPEIQAQSGTYYNYNKALAESLSMARVDLTMGSVVLIVGFILQLVDALGYFGYSYFGGCLLAFIFIFLLLYFPVVRPRLANLILTRVVSEHTKTES
jgi:hypothetical protein